MRKRSDALRRHILDTASRLFYAKGVRNVGIDEIIKQSGIARMTLYNHFGSKDQLAREYLRDSSEKWLAVYETMVYEASLDPRERLLAVFSVLDSWFRRPNFRGCWITNATVEMPDQGELIREAGSMHHAGLRALFAQLAAEAGDEHPEDLAELLLVLYRGAITSALVDADPRAAARAREAAGHIVSARLPVAAPVEA